MTALRTGAAILLLPVTLCLTCCNGAARAPSRMDDCGSVVAVAMNATTETAASTGAQTIEARAGNHAVPAPGLALRCW
jgi:hypothetical protein